MPERREKNYAVHNPRVWIWSSWVTGHVLPTGCISSVRAHYQSTQIIYDRRSFIHVDKRYKLKTASDMEVLRLHCVFAVIDAPSPCVMGTGLG
jgi:hypothetical protein